MGKKKKKKVTKYGHRNIRRPRVVEEEVKEEVVDEILEDLSEEVETPKEEIVIEKEEVKPKHKFPWIILLIITVILIILGVLGYLFIPRINLEGKKKIVINYKEKYKEPGYKAYSFRTNISKSVKVKGKVNSKKLGVYKITYIIKKGFISRKEVRTVEVKDLSKPKITLVNDSDIYVCPGEKYTLSEEYKAFDNYDGDITKRVKVKQEDDKITYTVTDKHKNTTSVVRKILYEDHEDPVLKLNGDVIYTFAGEKFVDKGYSATDNCDGDITNKVEVEGTINTNATGDYKLKYKVSDKAGNKVSVERKVIVVERGRGGVVYLTFDDGPKSGTTDVILDILKEEGVKATFFVTNGGPDELIKREFDEGHTVALHTATHDYAIYSSADTYFNDLNAVSERVKRITGTESKIIRFPGGSSNTVSRKYNIGIMSFLTKEVLNRGYRYYDWNISSGDAGATTDPNVVYSNVVNHLSHDRINMVLMHDIKPYTRDAIRSIIRYCKENGYAMEPITMATEMVTQGVNN